VHRSTPTTPSVISIGNAALKFVSKIKYIGNIITDAYIEREINLCL